MAALPTTLHDCEIVHVLSSKASAYGLTRAQAHSPPIPTSTKSLVAFRKAHPDLAPLAQRDAFCLELAAAVRTTRPDIVVLAGWMLILSAGFLEALVRDWDEQDVAGEGEGARYDGEDVAGRPIPIINLHPALPGTFPGAHAIQDAWDAFNLHPDTLKPQPEDDAVPDTEAADPPAQLEAAAVSETLAKLSLGTKEGEAEAAAEPKPRITKTGIMIHRVIPLLDAGDPVVVKEIEMREGESVEGLESRIHAVEHPAIVEAVAKVVTDLGDGTWWN